MAGGDVARRIAAEAPRAPGVYLFFGAGARLLYVGKSVDLRSRMLSYFRAGPDALDRRIQDMVRMVRTFRVIPTRSELEALLLEDHLIKSERPLANVSQKGSDACSYLVLTGDAYPALRVSERPGSAAGAARVFGPFKDRHHAARIKDLVVTHLGVRACEDPHPQVSCLRHDIGLCPGPCRGAVDPRSYAARVEEAARFLEGDDGPLVAVLEAVKMQAAASLALEKAAEARDRIALCRAFAERQRFVARFREGRLWIFEPGPALLHVFSRGRWRVRQARADESADLAWVADEGEVGPDGEDDRAIVDRAIVVHRWMKAHEGAFECAMALATRDVEPHHVNSTAASRRARSPSRVVEGTACSAAARRNGRTIHDP